MACQIGQIKVIGAAKPAIIKEFACTFSFLAGIKME